MGGNLFKDNKRLNKQEFEQSINSVNSIFNDMFDKGYIRDKIIYTVIPYYKNKKDFGDLDLIIKGKDAIDGVIKYFKDNNIVYHKNSNIISFQDNFFQVDLIFTKENQYQTSINYFSYNDLNNLLGRCLHKLGLKFGHTGASIIVRENEYVLGEIGLTQDINIILEILGVNPETFHKGFDTLEEIYEYVISSKWFDPNIFLLDNRNHYARTRDKKRSTYNGFLNHIRDNNIPAKFKFPPTEYKGGYNIREPYYTDIILKYFPFVEHEVNLLFKKRDLQKKFREKFPPEIVMQETRLYGKELGAFYSFMRENVLLQDKTINELFALYKIKN